jgi:hypothetical protein
MLSPFVSQKLGTFVSSENHEDMIVLKELIEFGKVTPVIDRTYPLSEVSEAIRYVEKDTLKEKSSSPCEARQATSPLPGDAPECTRHEIGEGR